MGMVFAKRRQKRNEKQKKKRAEHNKELKSKAEAKKITDRQVKKQQSLRKPPIKKD